MRDFLLRQGHPGEARLKEKKQMMDLIAMAKELIINEFNKPRLSYKEICYPY